MSIKPSTVYKFFTLLIISLFAVQSNIYSQISLGNSGQVSANAPALFRVTGRVTDALSGSPLDYASVAIYPQSGESAISGTLTSANGSFILKDIPEGSYRVRVEYMGYEGISLEVSVKEKVSYLGVLKLKPSAELLSSVTVESRVKERSVSIEKSRIDVGKSASSASGNLLEIIKSDPAVTIDNEDNLYIRGNKNVMILLDGKPTTLSSLGTLPASGVRHIEIITSPDVKYDAEGSGGIVNIISKGSLAGSKSMMATLNGGYENRLNGGLGLSYNNGKWGIDLGYSGRYEIEQISSDLTREIYEPYDNIYQTAESRRKNNIHSANLALLYTPAGKNIFGLNIKGLFPLLNTRQEITGSNPVSSVPAYTRVNDVNFSRKNIDATANFKHIFEKDINELSFDITFSGIKGSRPANYYSEGELIQRSEGGGRPTSFAMQTDYIKVLKNKIRLETGAKFLSRWNNFEYRFYDKGAGQNNWILNTEFSNDLKHKENVYAAYLSLSGKVGERLQYRYGARGEYFTSELNQRSTGEDIYDQRFSLFPFLSLKYGFNNAGSLSFVYNRRITRPSYPQLNPYINQIDHITYESGNKWLRPELTDKAEIEHTFQRSKNTLRTGIYVSFTKDYIAQVTNVTSGNKLLITYVNVPRYFKYGSYLDATINIGGKFSVSPSLTIFYDEFIDDPSDPAELRENNLTLDASGFAGTAGVRINYYPDKKTDLQLYYTYISPQSLPRFNVEGYHTGDIALKRRFLGGKITGNLSVTDIFNTKKWNIHSDNEVFHLNNNSKSNSRVVWLGITLNINSFKVKQPKGEPQTSEEGLIKLGY